jgi:hypothetical protein
MIIEAGALAVSAIALVLQRLDARRNGQREAADLRRALLALHEYLLDWHRLAQLTDGAVDAWILSGMPANAGPAVDLRVATRRQAIASRPVERWLAVNLRGRETAARLRRQRRSREVAGLLNVYAPELAAQFTGVVDSRKDRLAVVADEFERLRLSVDGEAAARRQHQKLTESAYAIKRAADDLAAYIRTNFPLP